MANVLSVYDPLFYAQEALIAMHKALGLANRVYRGYDRSPQSVGSVISIRVPGTFEAADAPSSAQDINASEIQVSLDYWREVKFELTDKELTTSRKDLIADHIVPSSYALADDIDQKVATLLYQGIPYTEASAAPIDVTDITNCRKALFNGKVPLSDPNRHFMVDGVAGSELLNQSAFTQWQGAGATGEAAQISGNLGTRFGFNFFENQNTPVHTAGALVIGTQLQLNANVLAGATSTVFKDSGGSLTGTIKAGDTFTIVGSSQPYVATADATAAANIISVDFAPAAVIGYSASDNVTIDQTSATQNIAFHSNVAALAMAPLSTLGNTVGGASMTTVTDVDTGLSIRSSLGYDINTKKVYVSLDVLFGLKMLRPEYGVRLTNV